MGAKVIPFRLVPPKPVPTLRELTDRVHRLVKEDPDCIAYSVHVKERMRLRGKTMRDILETLRKGEGVSGPTKDEYGDFRIKLRRCVSGRGVQVVVAVREQDVSVITVI